jgi:hypothetical protein
MMILVKRRFRYFSCIIPFNNSRGASVANRHDIHLKIEARNFRDIRER